MVAGLFMDSAHEAARAALAVWEKHPRDYVSAVAASRALDTYALLVMQHLAERGEQLRMETVNALHASAYWPDGLDAEAADIGRIADQVIAGP